MMADLDDLGFTSISDKQTDEAIELLRQIRLNRRTQVNTTKTYTKKTTKTTPVNADQAAAILAIIGGVDDDTGGESGDD